MTTNTELVQQIQQIAALLKAPEGTAKVRDFLAAQAQLQGEAHLPTAMNSLVKTLEQVLPKVNPAAVKGYSHTGHVSIVGQQPVSHGEDAAAVSQPQSAPPTPAYRAAAPSA